MAGTVHSDTLLRVKICSEAGRSPRRAIHRRTVIYEQKARSGAVFPSFLRFFSFAALRCPKTKSSTTFYSSSSFFTFSYFYHHLCSKDPLHLSSPSAFPLFTSLSHWSRLRLLCRVWCTSPGLFFQFLPYSHQTSSSSSWLSAFFDHFSRALRLFPVPPATPKVVVSFVTRSVFHLPTAGAHRRPAEQADPIAIGFLPSSRWKNTQGHCSTLSAVEE